jgi:hypothetical protein
LHLHVPSPPPAAQEKPSKFGLSDEAAETLVGNVVRLKDFHVTFAADLAAKGIAEAFLLHKARPCCLPHFRSTH